MEVASTEIWDACRQRYTRSANGRAREVGWEGKGQTGVRGKGWERVEWEGQRRREETGETQREADKRRMN